MRDRKRLVRSAGLQVTAVAAGLALVAGCGGTGGSNSGSGSGSNAGQSKNAPQQTKLIDGLPSSLKALYPGAQDPILPSALDSFKPVKGPWKLCFADSFEGNAYRQDVRAELSRLATKLKKAGKVASFDVAVSNGKSSLENSQIRSFVDKGCSVILSIPGSSTGDNAAIKAAHDKGIPFIAFAGFVTSPYAINVDSNYTQFGKYEAEQIAQRIGKNGTVLMIKGIEGQPVAVQENRGANEVWKAKGIKVVAQVNGDWTPSTTKSVVLQALATHPQKIDAVWTSGSELRFVADAFTQAHRPVPIVTGSPTGDALAYMHQHAGTKFFGQELLPVPAADTAMRVAVRVSEGQHPKLDTLMVPLPQWGSSNWMKLLKPCMKISSVTPFPVSPTPSLTEDQMNGYFTNGKATPELAYSPPDPCAGP